MNLIYCMIITVIVLLICLTIILINIYKLVKKDYSDTEMEEAIRRLEEIDIDIYTSAIKKERENRIIKKHGIFNKQNATS